MSAIDVKNKKIDEQKSSEDTCRQCSNQVNTRPNKQQYTLQIFEPRYTVTSTSDAIFVDGVPVYVL